MWVTLRPNKYTLAVYHHGKPSDRAKATSSCMPRSWSSRWEAPHHSNLAFQERGVEELSDDLRHWAVGFPFVCRLTTVEELSVHFCPTRRPISANIVSLSQGSKGLRRYDFFLSVKFSRLHFAKCSVRSHCGVVVRNHAQHLVEPRSLPNYDHTHTQWNLSSRNTSHQHTSRPVTLATGFDNQGSVIDATWIILLLSWLPSSEYRWPSILLTKSSEWWNHLRSIFRYYLKSVLNNTDKMYFMLDIISSESKRVADYKMQDLRVTEHTGYPWRAFHRRYKRNGRDVNHDDIFISLIHSTSNRWISENILRIRWSYSHLMKVIFLNRIVTSHERSRWMFFDDSYLTISIRDRCFWQLCVTKGRHVGFLWRWRQFTYDFVNTVRFRMILFARSQEQN